MTAYYNEHDPNAAAWLRELIKDGHIAQGEVDERDIRDVEPGELGIFTQCHFFAGIGGWSLALRMAGWSDDRPVWTGSCPCQPFSAAGRGGGFADERHLWPAFHWLIDQCRPATVFGEQVASKDGLNWFDLVSSDLEASGYAVGAADLCAAGVGAPHIRQRLWFVGSLLADAHRGGSGALRRNDGKIGGLSEAQCEPKHGAPLSRGGRGPVGLANGLGAGLEGRDTRAMGLECEAVERSGALGLVANPKGTDQRGYRRGPRSSADPSEGEARPANGHALGGSGALDFWHDLEWLPCRDGKARPTQPGLQPLAHGVSGRVGLLRGAGNAIVPQAAQAFIEASMTP